MFSDFKKLIAHLTPLYLKQKVYLASGEFSFWVLVTLVTKINTKDDTTQIALNFATSVPENNSWLHIPMLTSRVNSKPKPKGFESSQMPCT